MKRFKYDVIKLIEAVKVRPCLWNKTYEAYKDRFERKTAWDEIFMILEERYPTMSSESKRLTRETVLSKWTNIRDTFIKTLKQKASGKCRRHYILYNHLKFLLDRGDLPKPPDEEESFNEPFTKDDQGYEVHNYLEANLENFESEADEEPVRKRLKRERSEEPNVDFVTIDPVNVNDPRIMNEDEAFFASLLPTVVKYNEDERLEFRIEVLSLMRKIMNKRKWSEEA